MNDPTVVAEPVRCLFEGPSSSCDQQPSEAKMNQMVLFLLEGTNDKCTATKVKQAILNINRWLRYCLALLLSL